MPRYIDANNIRLTGLTFEDVNHEVYFSLSDVRRAIEQTPTADVVEVVHGEWIRKDGFFVCSNCDSTKPFAVIRDEINYFRCNYCNKCGAKMDGERKDYNG